MECVLTIERASGLLQKEGDLLQAFSPLNSGLSRPGQQCCQLNSIHGIILETQPAGKFVESGILAVRRKYLKLRWDIDPSVRRRLETRNRRKARTSTTLRRWEELLHQGFFVGLEGGKFFGFGGDPGVEGAEAVGDALLLGGLRG